MLLLLGKQKHSRDHKEVESYEEIIEMFGEELAGIEASGATAKPEGPEASTKVTDLLQATAAEVAQLQHKHIKVGSRHHLLTKLFNMCWLG